MKARDVLTHKDGAAFAESSEVKLRGRAFV
jgi:hypothetical protein